MARGDVRQAQSLLELAAQRGRDASTLLRLATVRRSLGDLQGAAKSAAAAVELEPRNFLMCLLLGSLREATGALYAAQRAYRAACVGALTGLLGAAVHSFVDFGIHITINALVLFILIAIVLIRPPGARTEGIEIRDKGLDGPISR